LTAVRLEPIRSGEGIVIADLDASNATR